MTAAGLSDLEDKARLDPEVLALAQRVDCRHDKRSLYPKFFSGGVKVKLSNGERLECFNEINNGAEGQVLSPKQVRDKFMENCSLTLSKSQAEEIWGCVMTVEEMMDIRSFTELLRIKNQVELY